MVKRQRPANTSAPLAQEAQESQWLGDLLQRRDRPVLSSAAGSAAAAHGTAVASRLFSAAAVAVAAPAPPGYPVNWDIVADDQHTSAICGHPAAMVAGPFRAQVWLGLFLYILVAKDGLAMHFGTALYYYILFLVIFCFLPDVFYEAPPPPPVAAGYWEEYLATHTPSPPPFAPRLDGPERGGQSWSFKE